MKWLLVILVVLSASSFIGSTTPNNSIILKRDTVPTGAAPQLFGSKLYEFKNYTLIDSFLMVMGGDTFAIPRWPALKYKTSDNRWYGYHGTRWRAFLNGTDTVSLSDRINSTSDIDVFLVAGQSNAKGKGDSLLSPRALTGKVLQINTGVIKDANDPMGEDVPGSNEKSQYGSAWPSFGNQYYNRTSRKICMVPSYKGGTSQCAAADVGAGNWDTTGILFDSAVARVNSAMSVLAAKGYRPVFKGVVWLQGESDAIGIQNGLINQTDYINAFTKMLRRFRTNFGAAMPFYVIRIGTSSAYIDTYWKQIRDAQQSVSNSDSMTQIVYYNAANFITRGLMLDAVHYNQVALNEVGQMTAAAVLTHNKNIWQPQSGSLYYANSGPVSIGGPPTEDFNLEIADSRNVSRVGLKIANTSATAGAFAAVRLYNDIGPSGFMYTTSSVSSPYRPEAFTLFAGRSGGLVLSASPGDIIFSSLAQGTTTYGRYVRATSNYLFNTDTDISTNGKFQINSTSWFNGLMKMSGVTAPSGAYNILVHGLDSGTYQVPVTALSPWVQSGSNVYYNTGNVLINNTTDNTVGKLQVTGKITVSEHAIASNSDSAVTWDRSTNEYKIAKINTSNPGVYFGPAVSFDPSFVVFASAIAYPTNAFSHGTDIIWGILDQTSGHNSSFYDSVYGSPSTGRLVVAYPNVKAVLNGKVLPDETLSGQLLITGPTVGFSTLEAPVYQGRTIGIRLTGDGAGNWTKSTDYSTSSSWDITTFNTGDGGTSFNIGSPIIGVSNNELDIHYIGPNGYSVKRVYSGLGSYNVRFILQDAFGNPVTANPTTSDEIMITNGGMQARFINMRTYLAGNNDFFTSTSNWWVDGSFECWLVASPTSATSTKVRWQTIYPSATNYKIYRSTTKHGARTLIHTGTEGSYDDTGLSSATLYFYHLVAVVGGVDTYVTYFTTNTQ